MPGEIDLPLPDAGSLRRGRFTYFPVAPGRLEFAIEVRQAILRERPEVVAVELPATLQEAWMRAVARLPEMSLIFYPDETAGDDEAVYVPIEPADPFTEAIRTGLEIGAEIVFTDPEAGQRPHLKDTYPDPYAIRHIGLARYIEAYRVYPQPRSPEIALHAQGIAWKLQGANPLATVFVVVSLNLLDPVLDAMEEPQAQPSIQLLRQYPALQWRYERFRLLMTDAGLIDRRHAQVAVFREAEKEYEAKTGERIAHWQRRLLGRFARNLALVGQELSAGIFDLTVAACRHPDDDVECSKPRDRLSDSGLALHGIQPLADGQVASEGLSQWLSERAAVPTKECRHDILISDRHESGSLVGQELGSRDMADVLDAVELPLNCEDRVEIVIGRGGEVDVRSNGP